MEGTTGSKWVWACVGRRRCGWCVILVVSSTGMHSGCGGIPTCYLNMSQVVSSCWRDLSLQVACSSGQPGSVGARLSEWHLGLLCWLWIWIHVHVGVWPTVYLSLQLRQLRFLYFTCVSSPWNSSLKYGAIVHNYIAPYLTMCWFGHLIKAVVPVAVTSLTQSHPRSTVVPTRRQQCMAGQDFFDLSHKLPLLVESYRLSMLHTLNSANAIPSWYSHAVDSSHSECTYNYLCLIPA